jgi:hypothetical protein
MPIIVYMAMLTYLLIYGINMGIGKLFFEYWSVFPKVDDAKEFYVITKTHFSIHI